jgi:septum formation protein
MKRIILASASPRRVELLRMIGLPFEQIIGDVPEETEGAQGPAEHVRILAHRKAEQAARGLSSGLVIGADTVVAIDGDILGKPRDSAGAARMLSRLSGRTHEVFTGVSLVAVDTGATLSDVVRTGVVMRPMSGDDIRRYVATGEPMDKAGAYAAQGLAAPFVERVDGCFYNVVGLPLSRLWEMLTEMGCDPWEMRQDVAVARGAT